MTDETQETEQGADAPQENELEQTEVDAEVNDSEDQESEAESPPADEENVEEKTNPLQERIDKLTKRFRDEERARLEREEEIKQLREQLASKPKEAKTLADFEYDEGKYQSYLFEEAERRAVEAAERVAKNYEGKARDSELVSKFEAGEQEFSKTVKDYHDKVYGEVNGSRRWVASKVMADEIRSSEMGPEIAYYLASNPDIALDIAKMPERGAVRELALLEVKLKAEKKVEKKVSEAPPPPTKIKASEPGLRVSTTDPASDKLSDEEWFKREEARKAKLRKR